VDAKISIYILQSAALWVKWGGSIFQQTAAKFWQKIL